MGHDDRDRFSGPMEKDFERLGLTTNPSPLNQGPSFEKGDLTSLSWSRDGKKLSTQCRFEFFLFKVSLSLIYVLPSLSPFLLWMQCPYTGIDVF